MTRILLTILFLFLVAQSELAHGQLFGSRSVKRSLSRQESNTVGLVQGDERFIRGRRKNSFVGADQAEMKGFVGSEQARTSGRIASPTGGMRQFVDRSIQINKPIPRIRKNDFYPGAILLPRSLMSATEGREKESLINDELNLEIQSKVNESIEVSVVNRTATLRGVAASSAEKNLAELLVRFEPGIDEIRNEIEVAGQ